MKYVEYNLFVMIILGANESNFSLWYLYWSIKIVMTVTKNCLRDSFFQNITVQLGFLKSLKSFTIVFCCYEAPRKLLKIVTKNTLVDVVLFLKKKNIHREIQNNTSVIFSKENNTSSKSRLVSLGSKV